MLRFVTPVMHFRRTATRATEIRGQRIEAGDKVVMYYVSANRDEEVFPDPDNFDVTRWSGAAAALELHQRLQRDSGAFHAGEVEDWGAQLVTGAAVATEIDVSAGGVRSV
jgi:cytochrome P450